MFDSFIHEPLKALRNTTVIESETYLIKILRKIFPPTPFIYFKQNFHPPRLFILSKISTHPVYSGHESISVTQRKDIISQTIGLLGIRNNSFNVHAEGAFIQ